MFRQIYNDNEGEQRLFQERNFVRKTFDAGNSWWIQWPLIAVLLNSFLNNDDVYTCILINYIHQAVNKHNETNTGK